jgi:M6 family metalloprotease-like protein
VPSTVFRINRNSSEYKIVGDGQGDSRSLIQDAINAADTSIDFTTYQFVTVVPPRDTKTILFSGAMVGNAESFTSTERNFSSAIWIGKNKLVNFKSPGFGWSFYAHEIGHVLGITHPYFQRNGGPGAIWDLMGNGGTSVPEFIGWHRFLLNWLNDNEVICLSKDSLKQQRILVTPINSNSSKTKVIIVRINSLQALFLEVRRTSTYDKLLKEETGAIVYRVDVSKGDDEGIISILGKKGTKREGQTLETIRRGERIQSDGVSFQVISSSNLGDTIQITRVKGRK